MSKFYKLLISLFTTYPLTCIVGSFVASIILSFIDSFYKGEWHIFFYKMIIVGMFGSVISFFVALPSFLLVIIHMLRTNTVRKGTFMIYGVLVAMLPGVTLYYLPMFLEKYWALIVLLTTLFSGVVSGLVLHSIYVGNSEDIKEAEHKDSD